ncbi:hypothetical protein CCYA_CCYA07G2175 [Cyanidiococcus yangmingshanensis]|nr:hypothetical protein CCYA_CCYA07G2175 [Cyanidiococcus yangmingshanensis]
MKRFVYGECYAFSVAGAGGKCRATPARCSRVGQLAGSIPGRFLASRALHSQRRPPFIRTLAPQPESKRRTQPVGAGALQACQGEPSTVQDPRQTHVAKPLRIILAGPPASGKGTQAAMLVERYGLVHISTGEMLRAAVAAGSELGLAAKQYMEAGELVPDELVIGLMQERMSEPEVQTCGWLLDGFPRTAAQIAAMDAAGIVPDLVISLDVPLEILKERVSGRRLDPQTGRIYHLRFDPPPANDEALLARLVQRSDDDVQKLVVRVDKYQENVHALKQRYDDIMAVIDGRRSKSEVFDDIVRAIGMLRMRSYWEAKRSGPPRIILLGPPLSGVEKYAARLTKEYGCVRISIDQLIRQASTEQTRIGMLIRRHLENNELVPDHLVAHVLGKRLAAADVERQGWLLDDVPRTIVKVSALQDAGIEPDLVLLLYLPHEDLEERFIERFWDPETGRYFHMKYDPPPAEDEALKTRLIHRPEDDVDTARWLLGTYYVVESELEALYAGRIVQIDGLEPDERIYENMVTAVQARGIPRLADLSRATFADVELEQAFLSMNPRSRPTTVRQVRWEGKGAWPDLFERPLLAMGDTMAFVLASWIARIVYSGKPVFDAITMNTAAPFIIVWLAGAPYFDAFMQRAVRNRRAALTALFRAWRVCLPFALFVRAQAMGLAPPLHFVVGALLVTFVLLAIWRLFYVIFLHGEYDDAGNKTISFLDFWFPRRWDDVASPRNGRGKYPAAASVIQPPSS